jgi:hypothetical protein
MKDYTVLAEEFITRFLGSSPADSTKVYLRVFADWLVQQAKLEREADTIAKQEAIWAKQNK